MDVQLLLLSRVRLFANPWAIAHQAPLSMVLLHASFIVGGFFTVEATREL